MSWNVVFLCIFHEPEIVSWNSTPVLSHFLSQHSGYSSYTCISHIQTLVQNVFYGGFANAGCQSYLTNANLPICHQAILYRFDVSDGVHGSAATVLIFLALLSSAKFTCPAFDGCIWRDRLSVHAGYPIINALGLHAFQW